MITVTINRAQIKARVEGASGRGLTIISNHLLEKANEYCRMYKGALRDSSITASQPENGLLIWNTPYAKRVYYAGRPSMSPNPRARLMWADVAAKEQRGKMQEMLQKVINQGV